jgi:hypothetical protein
MEATIEIRDWRNEIALPRDHPASLRVRDVIEAAVENVADTLAEAIGADIDRRTGEVILVRDLVFDCDLDVACDRYTLARALARRCAMALVRAVESGSAEVVRFPSRGALVAQFVGDVAAGSAGGRWYYRMFGGLGALPTSVAIRTALLGDLETGRAALTLIAPTTWPVLAQALEFDDAMRVLDELAEGDLQSDTLAEGAWISAFRDTVPRDVAPWPHVMALQFYAQALRHAPLASPIDALAASMLAAFAVLARTGDAQALDALQRGDISDLADLEPALARRLERPLSGPQASALRSLVRQARCTLFAGYGDARQTDEATTLEVSFGGLGMLIEEVGALLDRNVGAALARVALRPARELAALAAIAIAAGTDAHRVWRDAGWREFFGIAPGVAWSDYTAALRGSGSAAAEALEALWNAASHHLRGEPIEVPLRLSDAALICTLDASTGLWLRVGERGRRTAAGSCAFADRLAASRRARADARALDTGSFGKTLPCDWRAFVTALAQIALRRIAQRIPGMRVASLTHLRTNVLRSSGQAIEVVPNCWRWRVRRPPLHVLLALSGIARREQVWQGPAGERRVVKWDWV